jgi:hypothetical protein
MNVPGDVVKEEPVRRSSETELEDGGVYETSETVSAVMLS